MRLDNNNVRVDNDSFRRIIIFVNERSAWIGAACAISWARTFLNVSRILIVDHACRIDLPHTVIPLEEMCNSQSDHLTTIRSTTTTIPSMFLTLCGDSSKSEFAKRVDFIMNAEFIGETQCFVADLKNDLFVYVSAWDDTGDNDHISLRGLHSISGGGNLLLLADRATQRSTWEAALKIPGWTVLGCWVSDFGPPSVNLQLTRAFVEHSDWSKGTMECISLGVALGIVKHIPLKFRSSFCVVPLDIAANTALVAALLLRTGEINIPFTDVKGMNRSMSFYIHASALVWGMFAEYLLDYYGRFSVEVTGALPITLLLDPSPTLQLCSCLSDWANYGLSLMKPLKGYYIYYANERRKQLRSYHPASRTASHIDFAISSVDKIVQRVVAEAEVKCPEDVNSEFYTKLLDTVGESRHMRPLLHFIAMSSVKWDIYVKTIAQAITETFVSRVADAPIRLLPLRPIYNNDIVFVGERRASPTSLTPRKYFKNLHWALRCGMNANGDRMDISPGLTKDREELILQQESVQLVLKEIAEEEKVSHGVLRQRSLVILRTIGDTLNQYHVRMFGFMIRKLFFQLYDDVSLNEEAFDRLHRAFKTPRVQVVIIPAHRSYMDFLIMTYILVVMSLSPPHVCAGDDFLRMGPISTLMRGSGAFFMRRSLRGDRLYYTLFKEYLRQLVFHRQVLEFFIEGTRSRSGKMLSPKLGILKFITDAFFENQNVVDDIYFIPVSLSYDELLEVKLYADEALGTSKPKESIANLIRARTLLKERHGSIHVHVGEPLSLRQFRDTPHLCPPPLKSLESPLEEGMRSMKNVDLKTPPQVLRNLAWHICHNIEENTVVTSSALLAMVLNTFAPKTVISIKEAEYRMAWLRSHITRRKVPLSSECTGTEASELTKRAIIHLSRFVNIASPGHITVLPNIGSFMALSICSNQLIHVLLDEAVIAVAARMCGEIDVVSCTLRAQRTTLKECCQELHRLLDSEFPKYLPWCPYTFDSWFDSALSRFVTLSRDDNDYREGDNSSSTHSQRLHDSIRTSDSDTVEVITIPMNLLFQLMIRMMSPFVESLYLVSLMAYIVAESGEAVLRKNALLMACQTGGLALQEAGEFVIYPHSCSKETLKNALDSIAKASNLKNDLTSGDPLYVPLGKITSSVLSTQIQPVLTKLRSIHTNLIGKSIEQEEPGARCTLLESYQKHLADTKKQIGQLMVKGSAFKVNVLFLVEHMFTWRDGLAMAHTAMRSLYFPDEITIYTDTLIRFIFSIYYLPSIALVLAMTHGAIERIVWVLVVPVAQDMERQPYDSSHIETFLLGLSNIIVRILPFSTLAFSIAMLGHKALNCFVEAMVDAHSTRQGKDYPLLAARLRFVLNDKDRYYTFLIVLLLLVSVVLSGLHTSLLVSWGYRGFAVVSVAWTTVIVEICYVFVTIMNGKPDHLSLLGLAKGRVEDIQTFSLFVCDEWWGTYIPYMRHISIGIVVIFGLISLPYRGPLYVLSSTVELLMYLNIPYLVGHAVLSISTSTIRVQQSFQWLRRHSEALLPVFLLAFVYQLMLIHAIYFFRNHWMTVALLIWVSVVLITRAIDLVREFDVTKEGSVHWKRVIEEGTEQVQKEEKLKEDTLLPPYIAIVLEEAYEENLSQVAVVSLDLSMNITEMKLYDANSETKIERTQVFTRANPCDFLRNSQFYTYTFPRLLTAQSPGYFGGKIFSIARLVLRGITLSCLLIYFSLVCGMLLQAAFPQLRPWPVSAHASVDNSFLTIDHIVVRMHLLSNKAAGVTPTPLHTSAAMASAAFQWSNITSVNEDWYPSLCKRTFHGISIWEISLLALVPYLFNDEEVSEVLQFMSTHMGSDWRIRKRHSSDCLFRESAKQPTGWTGYLDFYSAKHDFSVIAIRGTDMTSFFDLLMDINIFFDVVLYHLLSNIVPGAMIIPSDLVADLLRVASVPGTTKRHVEKWESLVNSGNSSLRECQDNNYGRDFFADVYNHIVYMGSRPNPPKHVLLTGHSVGGSVASIIGAQMGIGVVSFGSPGISLSRKRFDIELFDIRKFVIRVMSSHDIFPKIGGTGGEEHHVECLVETRELCHAMEFLIGTLWRSCSSIRARYPSIASVE